MANKGGGRDWPKDKMHRHTSLQSNIQEINPASRSGVPSLLGGSSVLPGRAENLDAGLRPSQDWVAEPCPCVPTKELTCHFFFFFFFFLHHVEQTLTRNPRLSAKPSSLWSRPTLTAWEPWWWRGAWGAMGRLAALSSWWRQTCQNSPGEQCVPSVRHVSSVMLD